MAVFYLSKGIKRIAAFFKTLNSGISDVIMASGIVLFRYQYNIAMMIINGWS